MQKKNYVQEILEIIHSGLPQAELAEKLSDYHENDLADALTALTPEERQKVYTALGVDTVAVHALQHRVVVGVFILYGKILLDARSAER